MGESQSGGGVDTDAGVSGTTGTQDSSYSPPSYSSLGQSPGAMGGRPDPTPAPVVQTSSVDMPLLNDQNMSRDFSVNRVSRSLMDMGRDFFGGGTQTDDRGPSGADVGAVSVNDNQFNQGLASLSGVPDFVRIGGGTSSPTRNTGSFIPDPPTVNVDPTMAALRRGAPALMASNQRDADQEMLMETRPNLFPQELGGGTIASPPRSGFQNIIDPIRTVPAGGGDPLLFQDSRIMGMSPGAMGGSNIAPMQGPLPTDIDPTSDPAALDVFPLERRANLFPQELGGGTIDAPKLASLARSGGAKTQEELNLLQRLGRFLKGVGKSISNFEMNDIFEFLKGDPNYKGPSAAQQQLMGVPGPGPFVGGGAPSPSGGGGMAAPAKDPCPPGFRFDPTLQQCVPIIAPNTPTDTTTPTATPTTPATGTSPPAAGGIANAYPFTLTPPIGAPVGNLPPVRLTT